jgi:hypothetical protein
MFLCLKIKYLLLCYYVFKYYSVLLICYYVFNHYFVFHTQAKKATPMASQIIVDVLITYIYKPYNI